jgi:hypothetical protein
MINKNYFLLKTFLIFILIFSFNQNIFGWDIIDIFKNNSAGQIFTYNKTTNIKPDSLFFTFRRRKKIFRIDQ